MNWAAYPAYVESDSGLFTKVPSHWSVGSFAKFGRFEGGSGFPHEFQGRQTEELPFHKVNALARANQSGVLESRDDTVSRATARELGAKVIPKESLVFAKVGAALLLGRIASVPSQCCIDNNMMAFIPGDKLSARFARYLLMQVRFDLLVNPGAVPSVNEGQMKRITTAVPPLHEQQAVADFLDQETTKIDALIAKQEQLIATLREDRDAVWSRFFDEAADGEKPVKLRRAVTSIADGPFGSSLTSAHYVDDGVRVIRLGNIGINEFKDVDRAYISPDYARELSAHQVVAGDVIIAGLGDERMPLGRAVVVPEIGPAINKADCFRVRPKPGLDPEFLAWAMSAPQTRTQMALLARGATRARLNTSVVGDVVIPFPDREIQRRAVALSGEQFIKIDALIGKAEEVIGILQEYRSALITDAVTGKIDVRGVA